MDHPETSVNVKLKNMEQQLSEVEKKISSVESQLTTLNLKLSQVIDAILGNPLTKTGGFVEEIQDLKDKIKVLEIKIQDQEEQLKNQENFRRRFMWTGAILIGIGAVIERLVTLYFNIVKK